MRLAWRRSAAAVSSAAAAATTACPPPCSSASAAGDDDTADASIPPPSPAQLCALAVLLVHPAAYPLCPTRLLRAGSRLQGPLHGTAAAPSPPLSPAPTEAASVTLSPTMGPPTDAKSAATHTTELLRSIARRGGGAVRPRPRPQHDARTSPPTAALAALLRPATHLPPLPPPLRDGKATATAAAPPAAAADVSPSPQPSPPPAPPSRALLQKLLHTIRTEKRVHWDALTARHPEVLRMPLHECRTEWVAQQCAHGSAMPMASDPCVRLGEPDVSTPPGPLPPLLLCTAATGTGKSVLIPLFALDAHWAALEQRLVRTLHLLDTPTEASAGQTGTDGAARAFPLGSQAAFIREFTQCSRVCIVVSQPTRVACAELARYTSALLDAGRTPPSTSLDASSSASASGTRMHRSSDLVGKRVGFAVGGESCLCAATEIVFATPGYVLNALQLAPRSSSATSTSRRAKLSPTTLMVDEAHCRDLDTDALLAWVKLSRASLIQTTPRLRQYYVMSATMHLNAMYAYLAEPAHIGTSVNTALSLEASTPPPLTLLLSPAQRAHVRRWWRTRGTSALTSGGSMSDAEVDAAVAAAVHADPDVRAAILRHIEVAGVCGDSYASAENVDPASPDAAERSGGAAAVLRGANGAAVVIATEPHRIERFFVDDLDPVHGCFAKSRVLFGDRGAATPAAAAANSSPNVNGVEIAKDSHISSTSSVGPGPVKHSTQNSGTSAKGAAGSGTLLCLSQEGETVRQQLCGLFGTRASAYVMQPTTAQAMVTFVLQLLQAARCRWVADAVAGAGPASTASASATSTSAADAPVTLLLFVAGLGELQFIMQALERVCDMTLPAPARGARRHDGPSAGYSVHGAAVAPVLRHGAEIFSVGLLHSSAVGSPQEQLAATARAGAPLRLLIATNVAESSLTIPNTRIVLDTCLERRVRADDVTGATLVRTSFVLSSGLRQRCGRVGRTGDGIVIHLAPRSFVLTEHEEAEAVASVGEGLHVMSKHAVRAAAALEALPDGAVAVVLRMRFLFSAVSMALAALPSPPRVRQVQLALEQLADAELLLLPEGEEEGVVAGGACAEGSGSQRLRRLLDASVLTAKGRLVACLPLPHENATLVYHGLQFGCVEDAVLVACAAAVPSLFTAARVSPYSAVQVGERRWTASHYATRRPELDLKPALSPLEQFYRTLWVQRDLAGFAVPQGTPTAAAASSTTPSGRRRVEHLSEPLMLRALLRQWYAFSTGEACVRFAASHGVNRTALRQVDSLVALCCGRLIRLLQQLPQQASGVSAASHEGAAPWPLQDVPEDAESEPDFGVYVSDTTSASDAPVSASHGGDGDDKEDSAAPHIAFLCDWPDAVRDQVLRSLRRLHRVAQHRAGLRHSGPQGRLGLPQWHDSEERMVRLCSRPYVEQGTGEHHTDRAGVHRGDNADGRGAGGGWRAVQEAVRRHPCFAYWGTRMPAQHQQQSPYPSLYAANHTTGRVAVTPSRTVPPPLISRVTQARLPEYRPPPPRPPPIPSVVFAMGRTEDRLCGAYVAAYGHRTLRGEDGGHRFHHRRLRRNLQALEHDEAHVCTFHVDLQGPHQQQQQHVSVSPAVTASEEVDDGVRGCAQPAAEWPATSSGSPCRTRETAEVLRAALEPYLAGTGLLQLDVFQSKRLAVAARFATDGFRGLLDSHALQSILLSTGTAVTQPSPPESSSSGGSSRPTTARPDTENAVSASGLDNEKATGRSSYNSAHGSTGAPEQWGVAAAAAASADTSSSDAADAVLLRPTVLPAGLRPEDVRSGQKTREPRHHARANGITHETASGSVTTTNNTRSSSSHRHPFVQLAPFGVSLLVAATAGSGGHGGLGGLQRIPVPHAAMPREGGPASTGADAMGKSAQAEAAPPLPFVRSGMGRYGVGTRDRVVRYADAMALGLAHLLPSGAAEPESAVAAVAPSRQESTSTPPMPPSDDTTAQDVMVSTTAATALERTPEHASASPLTLSVVPPVYITHSITWKVPLPVAVPRRARADTERSAGPELPYCPLCNQLCTSAAVLQQHYNSAVHLEHLRHAMELGLRGEHLAVLYGGRPPRLSTGLPPSVTTTSTASGSRSTRDTGAHKDGHEVAEVSTLPLLSLRGAAEASEGHQKPVTHHLYACSISAQSFLNCLQMHTDTAATARHVAERATPLAVAGSLVASQGAGEVLPPSHLRTSRAEAKELPESLVAHHVWVLNFSGPGETHSQQQQQQQQQYQPPPTAALCIVGGYLAASSTQAMVALLFNRTHTHLHAVMLYGLGVWRLPTPLPMQRYMGVLEHISNGGGWPGLLVPLPVRDTPTNAASASSAAAQGGESEECGAAEGLHWCAPASACAMSAEEKAVGEAAVCPSRGIGTAAAAAAVAAARAVTDRDAVVAAALLLVLHEYAQARRSVVAVADYVERVLHKLRMASFVSPPGAHGSDANAVTPAEVLVDFMQRARRGQRVQSLLQDIGCLFATPPSALAALTDNAGSEDDDVKASAETPPPSGPGATLSRRLSYRALSSEGASLEMIFTVPPVLPSVLPPPDFASRLRRFHTAQHTRRWRRQRPPATRSPAIAAPAQEHLSASRRTREMRPRRSTRRRRRGHDDEDDELF